MPEALTQEDINNLLSLSGCGGTPIAIDNLTKCNDSTMFESDFEKIIANAGEKYTDVALAIIDIDNFMLFNENFGHKTGDDILSGIGKILLDIDAEKSVYRYSGDEFAVIFPDMEKEQAFLTMEKARIAISETGRGEEAKPSATVSIGISAYAEDGTKQTDLVRKAEGAVFRAKETGRNKVCLAREEKLVTKTAHYTVEQLKRLKELSDSVSTGEAALMREALDDLLKKYNARKKPECTVLIVDDAAFMRMMLKDILTKNGYKVVGEAADGKDGVDMFEELNPDFVLLDITMPNMDGLTALKKMKKKAKNRIIMVSAMGHAPYVEDSYRHGADAFVVKPFQADTVIAKMSDAEKYSGVPEECFDKFAEIIHGYVKSRGKDILTQQEIDSAMEECRK